jgi:hypothetical protein
VLLRAHVAESKRGGEFAHGAGTRALEFP